MQPTSLYYWTGKNRLGQILRGKTIAESEMTLATRLEQQAIIPIKIVIAKPFYVTGWESLYTVWVKMGEPFGRKIKPVDITNLLRQLSLLISAHIPLMQALEIVVHADHPIAEKLRNIIKQCQAEVRLGHMLSEVLSHYPKYFSALFCHWLEAGERSGTLDTLLEYWVNYQEKQEIIRKKIKTALRYPCFLLSMTFIIAGILLTYVVPEFEKLFHQFHSKLPPLTRGVLFFSQWIQNKGWIVGLIIFVLITGMLRLRHFFIKLDYFFDWIILKIPLIGKIWQDIAMARFSRVLSVMLLAGFPLTEALQWVAQTMLKNRVFMEQMLFLRQSLLSGITLNQAMSESFVFTPLLKQMTAIGEASGTLDQTLMKTADFYERKMMQTFDDLSQWIEPILMTIMGVIIGGFILAMYLPIFKMGELF